MGEKKSIKRAPRTAVGDVAVGSDKGRLRLRWIDPLTGKRRSAYVGLPDSKVNRAVAAQIAAAMSADIATQNYDPTLQKYLSHRKVVSNEGSKDSLSVVALLEKFIAHKQTRIGRSSLERYKATLTRIREFFGTLAVKDLTRRKTEEFVEWLRDRGCSDVTLKDRQWVMRCCWKWAIDEEWVKTNPWSAAETVVVGPQLPEEDKTRAFSQEEINQIFSYFRSHPRYKHYYELLLFRLCTGCRIGEAVDLTWQRLTSDCSQATVICFKPKSRHKAIRVVDIPAELRELLVARRPTDPDEWGVLVFPGAKGDKINHRFFSQKVWKPVLETLGIPYRTPYSIRHTVASHAIDQGMSSVDLAEILGNSPRTIAQTYASSVRRKTLPNLLQ